MKKNFFSLIAMVAGIGVVIYGIIGGGGTIGMFIDFPSLFIVLVGSMSSVAIIYPLSDLKKIPKLFNAMLTESVMQLKDLPPLFEEIAQQARKEGILSLESKLDEISDDFIKRGIQMVVDGAEAEELRQVLETEITAVETRHGKNHAMIGKWAELAPAFGMIGTVVGLIIMLGDLGGDPAALGAGMAVALITTLYGSFFQNIFLMPLTDNLKVKTANEIFLREVMIEGIIMIQNGTNPRAVRDKLSCYLSPAEREALDATLEKGSE